MTYLRYESKGEAIKAFKEGKLAKWELKVILEDIEFRENLSDLGRLILEQGGEGD